MKLTGKVQNLDTPAILVDLSKLDRNIQNMQKKADDAGAALSPHIKTHKCLKIARRQMKAGAASLTCAKLSEAEALVGACSDWFIAHPLVTKAKLDRLVSFKRKSRVRLSVESVEGMEILNSYFSKRKMTQFVMVKLDTGLKRTGIDLQELPSFLKKLKTKKNLKPVGIFTHEGFAYGGENPKKIRKLLDEVQSQLNQAGEIFSKIFGYDPILSPGCSMTAPFVKKSDDFDEVRPGAYIFGDAWGIRNGLYKEDACALNVLVTVVSVKKDGRVIIDGGSKTFSSDKNPFCDYGIVKGHPDLKWIRLTEELGVLKTNRVKKYKIGDQLEVIPAHVCPVCNLHNYFIIRKGNKVIDRWEIEARGCVK